MSQAVDNRVVKMTFDNSQFESGVKTSMSTLEKLKGSLNLDKASKSLSNLQSAGDRFSLSKMEEAVSAVGDRFSNLGVVGMTILQNLTNAAIGAAKNLIGAVTGPIVQGGISRAMNIEQAKFQLQGLGVAWDDIKEDIDYGVKDTAYGLDAAATAASQLVASGVEVGDSMKMALRGISGTAAMANSTFEEISPIFTKIAGNGKVMTQELQMLSSRGLNAAATLANFFNNVNNGSVKASEGVTNYIKELTDGQEITEEIMREFVSNKDIIIGFDVFSEAMDSTFGQHAKEANKTFTGATSNIRAALARVGADFVQPLIAVENWEHNLIGVANGIRVNVNSIKKEMGPLYRTVNEITLGLSQFAIDRLKAFDPKPVRDFSIEVANFWKGLKDNGVINNLYEAFKNTFSAIEAIINSLKDAFKEIIPPITIDQIASASEKIRGITEGFFKVTHPVDNMKKAINEASWALDTFNGKSKVTKKELVFAQKETSKSANVYTSSLLKLKNVFSGIFSLVQTARDAFDGFKRAAGPIVDLAKRFGSALLSTASNVSTFVQGFASFMRSNDLWYKGFKVVIDFISTNVNRAIDGVKALVGKFEELTGIDIHFPTFEEVVSAFESIRDHVIEAKNKVIEFANANKDKLEPIKEFLSGIKDKFIEIKDALVEFADNVGTRFDTIKTAFNNVFGGDNPSKLKQFFTDGATRAEVFNRAMDRLKTLLEPIGELFKKAKDGIKGFFESFSSSTSEGAEERLSFFEKVFLVLKKIGEIAWEVAKKVGSVLGTIGESLFKGFLQLDIKDVFKAGMLTRILIKIGEFIEKVKILMGKLKQVQEGNTLAQNVVGVIGNVKGALAGLTKDLKADALLRVAAAIGIFAVSLIALSGVPAEDLTKSLKAITALSIIIVGIMKSFKSFDTVLKKGSTSSIAPASNAILKISAALLIMSMALKKIGKLDEDQIGNGLLAITILLTEIVASTKILSKIKDNSIGNVTAGIIGFAAGMLIMASVIKSLGKLDSEQLKTGLLGFTAIMAEILIFMKAMTTSSKDAKRVSFSDVAGGLIGFAAGLLIITSVVKSLGSLDTDSLLKGLAGIGTILVELLLFIKNLGKSDTKGIIKSAIGITIIAAAISILSNSVKKLGEMKRADLIEGVAGLGVVLLELALAVNNMPKNLPLIAAGLLIVSAAISVMANAITNLGGLSLLQLGTGLLGLTGGLFVMAVALIALSDTKVLAGATGIAIVSIALLALIPVMQSLGSMSLGEVGTALLTLAGALTIIGVASALIGPGGVATLIGLGAAIALIGAGVLLAGAGLVAFSAGLAALGGAIGVAVESIVVAIQQLIVGLIGLIPSVIEGIGQIIIAIVDVLIASIPALIQAIVVILTALFAAIRQVLPDLVTLLGDGLIFVIQALSLYLPQLIEAGMQLVVSFLIGLADGIRENTEIILYAIGDIISAIIEFVIGAMQELVKHIPIVGDELNSALEEAKKGVNDFLVPEEGKEKAKEYMDGIKKGFDDSKEKFGGSGGKFGNLFADGLKGTSGLAFGAGEGLGLSGNDGILSTEQLFGGSGGKFGDDFNKGLFGGKGGSFDSGKVLGTSGNDGILSTEQLFGGSGGQFGEDFNLGLSNGKQGAFDAGSILSSAGLEGLNINIDEYLNIGMNAALGFANGIVVKRHDVEAAAAATARAASNAMKAELKVASPSKVTRQIGMYAGQGFALGMKDEEGSVRTTANDLANATVDSISEAVSIMMNALNENPDMSPTVVPYLDLSNVESEAKRIPSIVSPTRSIGIASNANGEFSQASTAGSSLSRANVQNAELLKQIIGLRGEVRVLGDRMARMKVLLDKDVLVGETTLEYSKNFAMNAKRAR